LLITGYFEISWKDEYLTWDPSQYGGKRILQIPKGKFWKPEIVLTKQPVNVESSVYSSGAFSAWVTNNGNVTLIHIGTYQTRCIVDTTLYPFDIHHCHLQFIVSDYRIEELMIHIPTGNMNTKKLRENGEWYIENTNAAVGYVQEERFKHITVPMVDVSFSLKRRPTFIINNIYAPITLMSSLNIATCYVRPDSGERLSFAVTLYLSLVFATTAAIDSIPNNSLRLPYMSYEILIINLINTIGVAWSIFIVHLTNVKKIDKKKIPNFILRMVMKRRKRNTYLTHIDPDLETEAIIATPKNDEVQANAELCEKEMNALKTVIVNDINGQEVAEVVDMVYFWLVFISIFVLIFSFGAIVVLKWAHS
jgi:hypothetical protein